MTDLNGDEGGAVGGESMRMVHSNLKNKSSNLFSLSTAGSQTPPSLLPPYLSLTGTSVPYLHLSPASGSTGQASLDLGLTRSLMCAFYLISQGAEHGSCSAPLGSLLEKLLLVQPQTLASLS